MTFVKFKDDINIQFNLTTKYIFKYSLDMKNTFDSKIKMLFSWFKLSTWPKLIILMERIQLNEGPENSEIEKISIANISMNK